jgi:N4-(beta-N-acetylglucosaminyl)-L-asparaginase
MWLYWKRTRSQHDDWRAPAKGESTGESTGDDDLDVERWFQRHFYGMAQREGSRVDPGEQKGTGTVHIAALDDDGNLASATSTSGHAFKLAGRVGDSPILGAGLYVDNAYGSCGSIGNGEANLENCSSFACVEQLRGGKSPEQAGLEILNRVIAHAHDDQRDSGGRTTFNLQLFLLAKDGTHAGIALWGPKQIAVADQRGERLEVCTALYERS